MASVSSERSGVKYLMVGFCRKNTDFAVMEVKCREKCCAVGVSVIGEGD